MNNLIWKQWRENRGYLTLFTIWMVLASCYILGYEVAYRFRAPVGHFSGWVLIYSIFAAIFLAMYTSLGERTSGAIGFSRALPVSMRKLAVYRISGAACALALPILIAAVVFSIALMSGLVEQAAPRDSEHMTMERRETGSFLTSLEQLWSVTFIGIFGGIELLLILSLIGSRLRTQSQVGFLGAVMGLGSVVASGLLWYGDRNHYLQFLYGAIVPQSLVVQWGYGALNGGNYTDHELARYRWLSLALAIPVLLLLGRLFVASYGRIPKLETTRPSRFRYLTPAIFSYFKFRFRSRWSSLLWLELRQSLPLVFYGFLFALLISAFTALTESHPTTDSFGAKVRENMPHNIRVVGMLWATVVGAGIFAAELDLRLGAFWRSRPISSAMWFWSKYLVGWLAVILILDGITSIVSWTDGRSMSSGMSWTYLACIPILHTLLYSLAVFGTCWLRKPVLGSFAALLSFTLVIIAIDAFPFTSYFDPINVHNELLDAERDGVIDFSQHGYPLVYGSMVVISMVLAWFSSKLVRPLEPQPSRWRSLMTSA